MSPTSKPGVEPDRIDIDDPESCSRWAQELDVPPGQLREAVRAVGPRVADVEMYLKGAHSTSNADRVRELGR